MNLVPLEQALDPARFGGKAATLARALNAGLPVPAGYALDTELVDAIALGQAHDAGTLESCARTLTAPFAVRSSVVGEDGAQHSFAGIHLTRLDTTHSELVAAIRAVRDSAHSPAAKAYRQKRGITGSTRAGVILQRLIPADRAAVVFTRDPVSHADTIVIEAGYGLGEALVSGQIVPDRYVLSPTGALLSRKLGDQDFSLILRDGELQWRELDVERQRFCLNDRDLARIAALVLALERVWSAPHDLELAFVGDTLYLLQRRALTGS